jgi:CHAD domain-containing protein
MPARQSGGSAPRGGAPLGRGTGNGEVPANKLRHLPVKVSALPVQTPLRLTEKDLDFVCRLLQQPWKRYRKALKRCQRKFSAGPIHDFRIEIRRLLASLELLGGLLPARRVEKLQRLLKRRLDLFDDLRDTQVQLRTLAGMRQAFPATRPFRKDLREREQRFARRACKEIRKVRTRRVGQRICECREHLKERLRELTVRKASQALLRPVERAFGRTCALRARIKPEDTTTIHHTRVSFKHFRYMVEALAERMPAATQARLAALHHYQTMMGDIQDSVVLLGALDKFLRKQPEASQSARRFRQYLVAHRQRLIRLYLGAADELLSFWPLPATKNH